jgi:hypothetical protein
VLLRDRPSFSELVARAREEVRCDRNEDDISIEKVFHMFSKRFKYMADGLSFV